MATYGLQASPGRVPFTGYSNTLGPGDAVTGSTTGYVAFNGVQQGDDRLAKMLRNGSMTSATTRILYTLLGAAVGGTATKTRAQVQGPAQGTASGLGGPNGLVTIETITLINRATTAADLTAFQALINRVVQPSTYPADLSGNGGGGKQTFASGGAY